MAIRINKGPSSLLYVDVPETSARFSQDSLRQRVRVLWFDCADCHRGRVLTTGKESGLGRTRFQDGKEASKGATSKSQLFW